MPLLLLLTKALPSTPRRPADSLSHTHKHTNTYIHTHSHTHTHSLSHTHDMHTNTVCRGVGGSKTKTAGVATQWQRGWLTNLEHVVKRTKLHN